MKTSKKHAYPTDQDSEQKHVTYASVDVAAFQVQPPVQHERQPSALKENMASNQQAERSAYLKKEIKQFLQDKQLLRQLEQTQNARAVDLLRSQIVSKSA